MFTLIQYVNGRPAGEHVLEPRREYVIGRRSSVEIHADDPRMSRRHCRLAFVLGRWEVLDLSSTNGTFVNDARVERALLHAGDVLLVGSTTFRIVEQAAGEKAPGERRAPAAGEKPPAVAGKNQGAAPAAQDAAPGQLACSGCGKPLPANAVQSGKASVAEGKVYCFACTMKAELKACESKESGDGLFGLLRGFGEPEKNKPEDEAKPRRPEDGPPPGK